MAKKKKQRLVVVSNRVPDVKNGKVRAGGLAVALEEALQTDGGIWFGWNGKVGGEKRTGPEVTDVGPVSYITMDLSRQDYNEYYNGFSNRTLWPLFHSRLDLTDFNRAYLSRYLQVNDMFAANLSTFLKKNDIVWVHDYHLIPLGGCLRERGHKQTMGIFLHTPFPPMEILTALPAHRQIAKALAAYDLVGFQTEGDRRSFQNYLVHEADAKVGKNGEITAFGRTFRIGAFPIGITPSLFEGPIADPKHLSWGRRLKERYGNTSWIIGVDRLDYSKGLLQRFKAYDRLLVRYPGYQKHVNYFQITPPSRGDVTAYKEIRYELEAEAGHINGRLADVDWVPINYINKSYGRERLTLFYRASQIGLVTPLRDGMNLVAKEYVAAQNPADPGVLVLSQFAGAAQELDSALIVNPYDADGVADAMARGLEMSLDERRERWDAMMKIIRNNDLDNWRNGFLEQLGTPVKKS